MPWKPKLSRRKLRQERLWRALAYAVALPIALALPAFDVSLGHPGIALLDALTIGLMFRTGLPRAVEERPTRDDPDWRPSLVAPIVITPSKWARISAFALLGLGAVQLLVPALILFPLHFPLAAIPLGAGMATVLKRVRGDYVREIRLASDGLHVDYAKWSFFFPWIDIVEVSSVDGEVLHLRVGRADGRDDRQLTIRLEDFTTRTDDIAELIRQQAQASRPELAVHV